MKYRNGYQNQSHLRLQSCASTNFSDNPRTCKYEKDPIKNSREKVATLFSHYKSMGIFSDAKGQLTPQYVVESRRISNSSEL